MKPETSTDEAVSPARLATAEAVALNEAARISPKADRRAELDFMRAFVVAGLVVFHSAVVFAWGTTWFVNDPHPNVGFSVFLAWGSLWGMPLLFLVSGMGVRYALRTRSAGAFVKERLVRLFLPLVVGLVVLVPPMFYLGRLGEPGFHESYWRFWARFLDVPAIAEGLLSHGSWGEFDPAHLWFLYVLLLWSIILLPLFLYLQRPRGRTLLDRAAGFTERNVAVVLVGAAIPMMVVEAALGPDVDTGGWERLVYLFLLLYGYLIASDRRLENALRRARRPALALALVATVALVAWAAGLGDSANIKNGGVPGLSALQALAGWLWIVSILGFAGSLIARRERQSTTKADSPRARPGRRLHRASRYANEAVLPFYVLHEPVIVAAAWVIVRWHAPIAGKYVALVCVSFAVTLALYEVLVRRFRIPRLLFGMKALPGGYLDPS
jgi:glucans biosynthesis protein C